MTTLLDENPFTHVLSPQASARILAEAIPAHAAVRLQLAGATEREVLAGFLSGSDQANLMVEVHWADPHARANVWSVVLKAVITVSDQRYFFDTHIVEPFEKLEPGRVIRFRRPTALHTTERRRSKRRRFQEPSELLLFSTPPDGAGQCRAVMLNLSPDGLACRVRREDASAMDVGRTLRLEFRVADREDPFCLVGRVVSLTQAATPHHVVIGMEFTQEAATKEVSQKLRMVLNDLIEV